MGKILSLKTFNYDFWRFKKRIYNSHHYRTNLFLVKDGKSDRSSRNIQIEIKGNYTFYQPNSSIEIIIKKTSIIFHNSIPLLYIYFTLQYLLSITFHSHGFSFKLRGKVHRRYGKEGILISFFLKFIYGMVPN